MLREPAHPPLRDGCFLQPDARAERRSTVEVVEIGTGGDPFHAQARALYESLGCTLFPTAVYFKQL